MLMIGLYTACYVRVLLCFEIDFIPIEYGYSTGGQRVKPDYYIRHPTKISSTMSLGAKIPYFHMYNMRTDVTSSFYNVFKNNL